MREIGISEELQNRISVAALKSPVGVVFPYGGEKMKKKYKICENTVIAIKHVLDGLPIDESRLDDFEQREHFLYEALLAEVPQIPVFAINDHKPMDRGFLAYYRLLANMFRKYFRFALFNPEDDKTLFGDFFQGKVDENGFMNITVPTMTAMIPYIKDSEIKYNSFQFSGDMMGPIDFVSCVNWLFIVNDQYRPTIPYNKETSYDEEAAEMKSIASLLKKRVEVLVQCKAQGHQRNEL